jgi:hypothetical protein
MGLTNLLKRQAPTSEPYFALEISHELVKAALWTVEDGVVSIINIGEIINLSDDSDETLLRSVDMALATANDEIDQEPDKVIFGLPEYWLDEGGIVPAKKDILKYLCKKLDLKPLGYVVTLESLVAYLKQRQGTPPSAIFVRLSKTELLISLVKLGKITNSHVVPRTKDISKDVALGIGKIDDSAQLPARIILYNGHTNFEDIKQQLLSNQWDQEFSFLHTPKIESLTSETSVEGIAIAGGKEVALSMGIEVTAGDQELSQEDAQSATDPFAEETISGEDKYANDDSARDLPSDLPSGIPNDIPEGFARGKDLTQQEHQFDPVPSVEPEADKLKPSKFNFSLRSIKSKLPTIKLPSFPTKLHPPKPESPANPAKVEHHPFPKRKRLKIRVWAVVLAIILVVGGTVGASAWWYFNFPKAQIVLYLTPRKLDQKLTITASTEIDSLDYDKLTIPAGNQEISVSGEETIPTTGSKRIGEKSQGTITIYNKTDDSKTFSEDTILVGPSSLRYVLTETITVASASSQETADGAQITFGKADATIIAGDIGEEYNQIPDKELSFRDLNDSDFSAKVATEISGGSSETIQVVSAEDIKDARTRLTKKLTQDAKDQLSQESADTIALSSIEDNSLSEATFSNEAGEEATELTISATLLTNLITAKKSDYDTILVRTAAKNTPDTFAISSEDLQSEILSTTENEDTGEIELEVHIKAQLLQKLDFAEIKKNISGKNPEVVEEYFNSLPDFARVKIGLNPNLPSKILKIPYKEENIHITVERAE